VFVRVGMDVRWDGAMSMGLDDMINEGVRRAYALPENVLRASILADPAGARKNTKDNTPAVIHYSIVPGQHRGSGRGGQGRRFREQVENGHAQPVRFDRRLGAQDRSDHGRRLVPAGHARHRHRRHAEKSRR
jgi:hypothetical protein